LLKASVPENKGDPFHGQRTHAISQMGYAHKRLVCIDIGGFIAGKQAYGQKLKAKCSKPEI